MTALASKALISAALIVLISELARRSTWLGALLAALPITSVLAMIWLYRDTGDVERIAAFSTGVFWLVLPSLLLFVVLPLLLRAQWAFWPALATAAAASIAAYGLLRLVLSRFGITL